MSIDCDCGTCCDRHGHDDDCMIFEVNSPQQPDGYDHDAYTL